MVQLFAGLLVGIIFLAIKGGLTLDIDSTSWFWIIILGLVNTGLGCYLYFSPMNVLSVQTVAVCGYLEPLSAVIFAAVFLHEQMELMQIIGAVLIIGGAVYCELSGSKQKIIIKMLKNREKLLTSIHKMCKIFKHEFIKLLV